MNESFKNVIANFKFIVKISWHDNKSFMLFQIFSNILRGPFPLIITYLEKIVIDTITQESLKDDYSFNTLLVIIFASIITNCLYDFFMTFETKLSVISINNIFVQFFRKILHKTSTIDKSHYDNPNVRDVIFRGSNFNYESVNNISRATLSLIRMIFTSIISTIVLFNYHYMYAVISLALYIPQILISKVNITENNKMIAEITESNRKKEYFSKLLVEKEYIKENRINGLEDYFISKYKKESKNILKLSTKIILKSMLRNGLTEFIKCIVKTGLYGYLVFEAFRNNITIGTITLIYASFNSLNNEVSSSVSLITTIYKDILSFEYFNEFLNIKNTIINDEVPPNIEKKIPIKNNGMHKIEFRDVGFAYPGSNMMILRNLNFEINRGETVALVGLNGAGKTTIAKLLLRLYDCTEGQILLDDINIKDYSVKDYYTMWGVLLQDFNLYPVSIRKNILFNNDNSNNEQIENAAKLSDVHGLVMNMPHGYETVLTTSYDRSGYEPSGGQAQKFAMSKIFHKKYEMYLLDEPSAAIDPVSEQYILESIMTVTESQTTVLISHRLSNITNCDRIIFLDKGEINGIGAHDYLIEHNSLYKKYYSNPYGMNL